MTDISAKAAALLAALFVFIGPAGASVAPPSTEMQEGFPLIRVTGEGHVRVEDPINQFRLSLPAPYWETKTPGQVTAQQGRSGGGGCTPGRQVPQSLMLVMRNKDARAAASLELKPERFRMRGREDLEDYVAKRNQMVVEQSRGAFEAGKPSYKDRDGMIVHRTTFTSSGKGDEQKYVLVDYFVRPEGEKARVYQLACIATAAGFARLQPDYEHIIGSFRYTGPIAEGLFTPEASPEDLPEVKERGGLLSRCGGSSSGMFVAMAAVFIVYMILRRRGEKSGAGI